MAGVPAVRAEKALREASAERSLFRHIAREHAREGRRSYVEIDAPLELYALARLVRPQHVLEVGVSSGVSSAYMLRALQRNRRGTLHSIDLPSHPRRGTPGPHASWTLPPGRAPGWAIPLRLRDRWSLSLGDKSELVPQLALELPRVDLFFYDVPHDDRTS
jgi:hypothetical protein